MTTMKHLPFVTTIVLVAASVVGVHAQTLRTDTVWHSTIGTRSVSVVNQWDASPLTGAYSVRVVDQETAAASEIALPHVRGAVSEIRHWHERVIVIVRRTATVVDVGSGSIVAEFLLDSPEFLEDGRIVTYHPILATGEVDPLTRIYEMGPAQN